LGVYPLIIASLADFVSGLKVLQLDYSAILVLLNVLIGIIVGAFCFARIASWLLRYYLDMSIAILSGFMIGALRSVWPFWNYDYALDPVRIHKGPQILLNSIYFPSINSPLLLEAVVCVVVGFAVVFFFEYFSQKVVNKRLDSTPTS
jgi:putative membrane protein